MRTIVAAALLLLAFLAAGCSKSSPTEPAVTVTSLSSPWPPDTLGSVARTPTLCWSATARSGATLTYDVLLGTTSPPATAVVTGQDSTRFVCPALSAGTKYWWKVVAHDAQGAVTEGPTWSFTTTTGAYTPGMVDVAAGTYPYNQTSIHLGAFSIDRYETTYDLWDQVRTWGLAHGYGDLVAGSNGYLSSSAHQPVGMVNYYDVAKWCNARSEMEGLAPVYYTSAAQSTVYRTGDIDLENADVKWSADGYRLPTEAEWKYAARGGTRSNGYTYSGSNVVQNVAWCLENAGGSTHPVGQLTPNELGLFDMSGNDEEMVWDWWVSWDFPVGGTTDPRGPDGTHSYRVVAGGVLVFSGTNCRVDTRSYDADGPSHRLSMQTFRCVRH